MDADLERLLAQWDEWADWQTTKLKAVLTLARERIIAGHSRFGNAWESRDNLREALEEDADGQAYRFFAHLQEYGKV